MLESLAHDVRYAARSLIRQPGVTVLAAGILAVGLGLNSAVLAVAYGVLWRPLPYPAADRLVTVARVDSRDGRESAVWLGRIDEWNRRLRTVRLAGYSTRERVVRGAGPTRVRAVTTITEGFFEVLGVPAVEGAVPRLAGGDGRAVISAALARDVEDETGRPAVGQAMTIGEGRYDVAAVMPAGFAFPSAEVDAWVADQPDFRGDLGTVGRMRDGASLAQVRDDAARVAREVLA
ncbi:MAG: ABC transporter permease, partial [bacterium]|nr:ABC transporter permease [bacterium]